MKKTIMFSAIALAMTIAACNNATKTDEKNSESEQKQTTESTAFVKIDTTKLAAGVEFYQCPMHLEEVTDKNVPCPQCGMDLDKVVKK